MLERGEHLARRKEIYEKLHPQSKQGGDHKSEEFQNQSESISFCSDVSKALNLSKRTVEQEIQIANNLDEEVKEAITDTPLEDNKIELLVLAREDKKAQKLVLDKYLTGEATSIREAKKQVQLENVIDPQEEEEEEPIDSRGLYLSRVLCTLFD